MGEAGPLKKIRDKIEYLLSIDERCRNDDRYLYACLLEQFYGVAVKEITFWDWIGRKCPDYESARRVRNKIQSDGKYPPTDPIVARTRGRSMLLGAHEENHGREADVRRDLGYEVRNHAA